MHRSARHLRGRDYGTPAAAGRTQVRVETVERWQGLQLPISIVRHPLSRAGRPVAFDLKAGVGAFRFRATKLAVS